MNRCYCIGKWARFCHLELRCLQGFRALHKNVLVSYQKFARNGVPGKLCFSLSLQALRLKSKGDDVKDDSDGNEFSSQNNVFSSRGKHIFGVLQFLKIAARSIVIWCIAFQIIFFYPVSRLHEKLQELWWKIVLKAIEFSGPVFVKFCQWASTRRDIFSAEICDHLTLLQHQRTPHSWKSTVSILDSELGESWRSVFVFDGPQMPIGSGCVAQVYKMYLKSNVAGVQNGNCRTVESTDQNIGLSQSDLIPVALKVLHPNIHQYFYRDTMIITHIAAIVQFFFPWLKWISLNECVGEFSRFMLSQIDLEKEAFYLEKFSENFSDVSYIRFPQPMYPFVTKNILVESWEEGDLIGKYLNTQNLPLKKKLSEVLVDCLLKMTFVDNLVHGDLHPGNILVQKYVLEEDVSIADLDDVGDTTILSFRRQHAVKNSMRVVLLDCGLSTALSPKDFANFYSVFKAIVMGQGEVVGRLFLKHCTNECRNPDSFVKSMADLVAKFRANTLSLDVVDVGKLFSNLFDVLTKHKVKLESSFSSIMMAIIIVEGLGRSLDPEKDIMQDAKRFLLHY